MGAVDILRLKPAFTDEQAEALARLIDENLATKQDIEALRRELKSDIETTRAELRLEIERLRSDVEKGRGDLIKWIVGMGIAVIGVLFTLIRFFG